MIFKNAFYKEFTITTGIVFIVLVTLIITNLITHLLSSAVNGNIHPKDMFILIGFGVLGYLSILLTISIFISILVVITRWYKDSEMIVWRSSGLSLFYFLRLVIQFVLPIVFVISFLSIFISPWARNQSNVIKQRFIQTKDISMLPAGQFQELSSNNYVLFIESINPENNMIKNIFISELRENLKSIIVTKTGYIENTTEGRKLILYDGRRYEQRPETNNLRIIEFKKYTVILNNEANDSFEKDVKNIGRLSILDLLKTWNQKASQGEIVWRIGVPFMALVLSIIAIPIAYVDPRHNRNFMLILGMLIYFIYSNSLKLMQTWVTTNKISFSIGFWMIHIIFVLFGLFLTFYLENFSTMNKKKFSFNRK